MKKVLSYIWASPLSIVAAFLFSLAALFRQAKHLGWKEGAWEWEVLPGTLLARVRKEWGAMTLGWCILYSPGDSASPGLRRHEQVHVRQSLRLGIFWPILYLVFLAAIWCGCPGLKFYEDNPFELEAYRLGPHTKDPPIL